jgi:hypothetical protein
MLGRIEIKSHDGFQFLGELRIVADFKGLHQVRFEAMRVPDPTNCCLAYTNCGSHGSSTPMSCRRRLLLSRLIHDLCNFDRGHCTRPARPRGVLLQGQDAATQKTIAPAGGLLRHNAQLRGDCFILTSIGGPQHDARSLHQPGGKRSGPRLLLQQSPLFGVQNNGSGYAHPSSSIVKTARS